MCISSVSVYVETCVMIIVVAHKHHMQVVRESVSNAHINFNRCSYMAQSDALCNVQYN
jgi:hypothetical protein